MPGPITGGGGGSGASQLPAWTYTSGSIGAGLFTTDNATIASTGILTFSSSVLSGTSWSVVPANTIMQLVDSAGKVTTFKGAFGADAGNPQISVNELLGTTGTNWSGKYTVSFAPYLQTAANVGLGNVDNTSDANKPVSTAQATADSAVASAAASDASTKANAAQAASATSAQGAKADSALQPAAGFNGTGTYINFTIVGGQITNAS